jgi:hypothetical protein
MHRLAWAGLWKIVKICGARLRSVSYLIQLNGLPLAKEYWVQMPKESNDVVWASRDGNYVVSIEYEDIDRKERIFAVFIWTAQAHKAVVER